MTLLETISTIESVASMQPSVKMIVESDVYKLNTCPDALYGAFAFVEGQHTGEAQSDFIRYNFTLFYVDRLKADKSNLLEVHSVAAETLGNIIRNLDDLGVEADSYTLQPFTQRFADECAGMYATVTLNVLNSPCGDTFTENNNIKII